MITFAKKMKIGRAIADSRTNPLPVWVHLWVTDRCNLSCDYCDVVKNMSPDPPADQVESWIRHADSLGSAAIAFMGGEPMLRHDLSCLVAAAHARDMITYVSTNGTLLTSNNIQGLAKAGLDLLEVSCDGYHPVSCSKKSLDGNETLIDLLERSRKDFGLRFKIHQVLAPSTLQETPKLLALAGRREVPISFGMVQGRSVPDDKTLLRKTLALILQEIDNGAPVINPSNYFLDAMESLDRPVRMECDVGRYMIQVATDGYVYSCARLRSKKPVRFLDVDKRYFIDDKHGAAEQLQQCADRCLSACAYTAAFMRRHPQEFVALYGRL